MHQLELPILGWLFTRSTTAGRNYESCDFQAQTLVIGLSTAYYLPLPFNTLHPYIISVKRAPLESLPFHLRRALHPLEPNVLFSQVFVWMSRKQSLVEVTQKVVFSGCKIALHMH